MTHKYFSYCTSKSADGPWSTSSAKDVTYSTGVDVGPVHVSAQSGHTKGLTLTFNFSKASNSPYASSQVETHAS